MVPVGLHLLALDLLIESLAAHAFDVSCVDPWLASPRKGASSICAHSKSVWRPECLVLSRSIGAVRCGGLHQVVLAEEGALALVTRRSS